MTERPASPPSVVATQHGSLFSYADAAGTAKSAITHGGPYAIVDVETTGFSPRSGDRVIEIAIARVDARGRIEDEFATLLNPEGRDTGPVFVHGISNDAVRDAPSFTDVAGEVLSRLEGAVVVAHNAAFEERFLGAELARAGIRTQVLPALCTLWLGQRTFNTPNHKLGTIARHMGLPATDAHAALGDVRTVAALLPTMLDRHGAPLVYDCPPASDLRGLHAVGAVAPVTRAVNLRKGTDGWMASLLSRLPMTTSEATDVQARDYLDLLSEVLADGKIVGDEIRMIAKLAGAAGMGAAQVAALNERYLEQMRDAALSDNVITSAELAILTRAAAALGVNHYFDDLSADDQTRDAAQPGALSSRAPAATAGQVRRCGHCRTPGHYRSTCPDLVAELV